MNYIKEKKLRALTEKVLNELDWRTYQRAADKRMGQRDNAYSTQDWDKGAKMDNSAYELQRQAQKSFNQKHAPGNKDSKYTFYRPSKFDGDGKRTGTFAAQQYNPNTGISRTIQNGQSTERMVNPQQNNYAVPTNGTMSTPDAEVADFQSGKSRYNKSNHQWESVKHEVTSRVISQLRESEDKHITLSHLHSLVEGALNELDWKTYMNASKKLGDADKAFRDGDYTNPVVLRTITRAFAKKFGMKKAKMLVDGLSEEQFDELVDMLGLYPCNGLDDRQEALKNAATDAFARKYGHSRKVDHSSIWNYMPPLETVDPEGYVYNMEDNLITTPEGDVAVEYFPNIGYNPWETNGQNGERLKNGEAMQDLAKYNSGESRYNKDTHQYEALKRRIVDKLLESAHDPQETGEYDDPVKEAAYQSAIECQRRFGSYGRSYNKWKHSGVYGPEAMEIWQRAQLFLAIRGLGYYDDWYDYKYKH
ncbi:MAG: hypothetical protein LUD72_02620 [Bacteroidales bacterium]|nr:hypothetical protein [Bacteroidales bacterium]